jgi:uncharacterized protein (TIGR02246 family)
MDNDEREIRELVSTWMSATQAGDTEKVLSLMSDDVVFLIAGQPPMIGKQAYASAARALSGPNGPKFSGKSDIQEIEVAGDRAFMWTRLTVVVTPPGGAKTATRTGHTLSVLKKQNGKWLLARDANMLTQAES